MSNATMAYKIGKTNRFGPSNMLLLSLTWLNVDFGLILVNLCDVLKV